MPGSMTGRFLCAAAFGVFIALLTAAPSRGFAQPAPTASPGPDALGQAQALFRLGKYREAISKLDALLQADPRDARALVLRGDAKAEMDDNSGALKDYNAAIGIAPEYQYAYVTRCETRLALDDPGGALTDCNTALRLDATDAHAYQARGDVYFDREAYDLAVADYEKSIALGRRSAYLYASACDANRLVGKLEQAATDCEEAITINPKSRRALWSNARLALVNQRYSAALGNLNTYIAEDPSDSSTGYYFRAVAYNRLKMYQKALDDLQIYVKRTPDDADGYKERAIAKYGLGDKTGALADLETARNDYAKAGDTAAADKVAALSKAIQDGSAIPEP
jgi:tetratricopeptide (TPR) repeat protein